MPEYIINISSEKESLVKELVVGLGGSITIKLNKKNNPAKKITPKEKSNTTKKSKEKIDHTYLFGKWKNFDIDAKKLRGQSW